jgi:hypothetical protein
LILKLYIFLHFLYEFILYHRQNGNHSCKSNKKDKELELDHIYKDGNMRPTILYTDNNILYS